MKIDIILAGVGGQGIISIAASIGMAALHQNLFMKQAEVHGMSQRGGSVHSDLRIADKKVASDLIPLGMADLILSVEPMEGLRYLPYLAPDGWLVTNSAPFINIPDYPDIERLIEDIKELPNHIILDADKIASDLGSKKSGNMVILGAATPFMNIPFESFKHGVRTIFKSKGDDIVEVNLAALRKGREFAENMIQIKKE
jgi:indolepyruvate ferredoxin oxidoreductase, beta subunit